MDFTGERFIPSLDLGHEIYAEHYHRYMAIQDLVKDKRVLDAACGEGYGADILAKYASEVIGIDICQESIEWAAQNYTKENLEFQISSIEKLPFSDNSFDVVVSFETIEHVNEEIQNSFLKEIARVLKKDGVLLISTPNKEVTSKEEGINHFHIKEFYKEEFKQFLSTQFAYVNLYTQNYGTFSIIEKDLRNKGLHPLCYDESMALKENYFIAVASHSPDVGMFKNTLFEVKESKKNETNTLQVFYKINNCYAERDSIVIKINKEIKKIIKKIELLEDRYIEEIRIDPLDKNGVIQLNSIKVIDQNQNEINVIEKITSNAIDVQGKQYTFITDDPQIIIPLSERCLISSIEIAYEILAEDIDINYTFNMMIDNKLSKLRKPIERWLYVDSGKGFNEIEKISINQKEKEIDISDFKAKNVRIDISNNTIYVQVNSMKVILDNSSEIQFDVNNLNTNAELKMNNQYIFFNKDSQILISEVKERFIHKIELDYTIIEEGFEIQAYHNVIKNVSRENQQQVKCLGENIEHLLDIQKNITYHNTELIEAHNELLLEKNQLINDNNAINIDYLKAKDEIIFLEEVQRQNKEELIKLKSEIEDNKRAKENLYQINNRYEQKIKELEEVVEGIKNSKRWKVMNFIKKYNI